MILTPPDVISQILIAIPMWLLFELGLIFSPLFTIRDRTIAKAKNNTINWSDKNHNAKMDKLEKEMNKKVKDK